MTILFVVSHGGYLRHYADVIRLLASKGHVIRIGIIEGDSAYNNLHVDQAKNLKRMIQGIEKGNDRIEIKRAPVRKGLWIYLATGIRKAMDYIRFLDPYFDASPKLKKRSARNVSAIYRFCFWLYAGRKERLPRTRWLLTFLQRIEAKIPGSKEVNAFVQAIQPDILLVSPLVEFGSSLVDYIKTARILKIPSALCVASWDNLTNKGHIRIEPSKVIVWNHFQREEAIRLHSIHANRIVETGAQTFDEWFSRVPKSSRRGFLAEKSLPLDRPYILYLCSSSFITPNEVDFVKKWVSALRSCDERFIRDMGILIRPHPMHSAQWEGMDFGEFEHISIWPKHGEIAVDEETKTDFFESIFFCAAVMGINTSGMIEAGIIGRPVFSMRVPEFQDSQMGTIHFHYLVKGGLLNISDGFSGHLDQMPEVLKLSEQDQKKHSQKFVLEFIRPHGLEKPCVPILVEAIENLRNAPTEDDQPLSGVGFRRVYLYLLVLMAFPWFFIKTKTIVFLKKSSIYFLNAMRK
ncbi:MAG: hypothetical protein EHM45_22075 [Desulfobacteraceae bacterium]|nr:MAG: hypothetical protein EHM45_22075 [Desulfobacteraceae bacterium]